MPSNDETVVHKDVLCIHERIRDQGWPAALAKLEIEEPVLAGYAVATVYRLEKVLLPLRLPRRVHLLVEAEVMTAQLVGIESMRQASRKLWHDFLPEA